MTRRARLATAAVLAAAVSLTLSACDRKQAGAAAAGGGGGPPARPPAAVTVAPVVTKDVPIYLDEIGRTVAVQSVSIIPQVGGKIIAAHVNDGDYVEKGQVLFEIDPRPFQAALAQEKATLTQAKADLTLAQSEYQRMSTVPANAVMAMEIDQKKAAVDVAQAKIEAANAAIESAALNLEYTTIVAPISGRAGARLVDPGNVVKENDKTLLVIQQLDPIYAEFTITENDLGTVRKYLASRGIDRGDHPERGLTALVDLPADSQQVLAALGVASPSSPPSPSSSTQPVPGVPSGRTMVQGASTRPSAGPREGTLTFLDNTVQNGSGTIRLRATLPNKDRYFWPGQFVNVRLILATHKDAVLVPTIAQQLGQQGPFVYVVKPDDTAEIRPIAPGQRQGDLVVVDRGLSAGERVITAGQMMVAPGGKVRVTNGGPPPPTTRPEQTAVAR